MVRVCDELDQRRILFDGVGQGLVGDTYHRSQPVLTELVDAAPELFSDVPIRATLNYPVFATRDVLKMIRGDLLYAIEIGASAGLCDRPAGAPHGGVGSSEVTQAPRQHPARKVLIGVAIAVISAGIIFGLRWK